MTKGSSGAHGAGRIARLLGHSALVSALLVGCATAGSGPAPTASPSPAAPPASTVSCEPALAADVLADAVCKVHQQYIESVSVARLTMYALRGVEAVAPGGAIRVVEVENGATITHGDSGLPDSSVSVAWPATPKPSDAGRALDEAAQFIMRRLDVRRADVLDALGRGLMRVDPQGAYITQVEQAELSAGVTGSVGLEIAPQGGELMIVTPLEGGPGDRAGLRGGDRISAVDGVSLAGMTLADAVRLLRGAPGSRVVLRVTRAAWDGPRDVAIVREVVREQNVEYRV